MTGANIGAGILSDATFLGMRLTLGTIFVLHGFMKLGSEGFTGFMGSFGISPEFALIIALGELVPGIMLMAGVLSRISAGIIALIMVAAIIIVKSTVEITGDSGIEFDLILLAASLVFVVAGPGRMSVAHVVKRIPKFLH